MRSGRAALARRFITKLIGILVRLDDQVVSQQDANDSLFNLVEGDVKLKLLVESSLVDLNSIQHRLWNSRRLKARRSIESRFAGFHGSFVKETD